MKNLLYLSFLFFSVLSFGQGRTISGNVISAEDGLPLPGASVMIKNTTRGVQTDFDGNYSLVATPNDTLVFSFVGMKEQKIRVGASDIINVQMQEDRPFEIPRCYPAPRPQSVYTKSFRVDKNPKKAFRENKENNTYIIFISEQISYSNFSENELKFQQEYNIMYASNSNFSVQYRKKHNKLTFKHLNKKYKKSWQTEIRKDAIGLDEFLK